jgi:hypothetical protein
VPLTLKKYSAYNHQNAKDEVFQDEVLPKVFLLKGWRLCGNEI